MKRGLVAIFVSALMAAGCAAGSEASSPSSPSQESMSASSPAAAVSAVATAQADPTEAVDAVIDQFVAFSKYLDQNPTSTPEDAAPVLTNASKQLSDIAEAVKPGLPGVPADVSGPLGEQADAASAAVSEAVACLPKLTDTGCDAEASSMIAAIQALGDTVNLLVPYGSRSQDSLMAELDGTPEASASADASKAP